MHDRTEPPGRPQEIAGLAARIAGWCRHRPVRLCVLFGSRACGRQHPDSDLDVALWTLPLPPVEERVDWQRQLSAAVELPVQLVFATSRLDPVLGFQIAREGVILHEAEPGAWVRERVRLWHLYQDNLPFLRASRRRLQEFARKIHHGS